MRQRLVVIGGDAAGMSAASVARRRRSVEELDVVVFERGNYTSYSACGIPYWIGNEVADMETLVARTPAQHRANGLDVQTGCEVVAIDTLGRSVTVRSVGDGSVRSERYDELLIATGSVPNRPAIPGIDAPNVHGVQVLDDGVALRATLDAPGVSRVVVVGGGYIGLEIAEAAKNRSFEVTVIDRSHTPIGVFDDDVGEYIAAAVRGLGIGLVVDQAVDAIVTSGPGPGGGSGARGGSGGVGAGGGGGAGGGALATGVRTADGTVYPADVVVLGLGVRPNVELARSAGIPVGAAGGIIVDQRMHTPVDGVWAAGDCVESLHRVSGQRVVIALGTHANKQGRVAGINLSGGYATFPGVIGTAVTKVCAWEVARTGLSEREAAAAGFEFVTAAVDATTRAGYYPGTKPIRVKLVAERHSGRLLGAQIVGHEGAAKRIDVLATAIWNGMDVGEMISLDLSYAPPFAPVWDPVLVAARQASAAVERDRSDAGGGQQAR